MTKRKSGVPLNSSPMIDEFILNYMKQNGITQEQLAERLGIKQSKISEIKNKANRHFDVEDICNFAIEYNQSIDEMADIYNRSESVPKREKTFKDILSRLYYIHSSGVGSMSIIPHDEDNTMRITIDISGKEMIDIMKQWQTATNLKLTDKSGQKIIDIVKESLLKQAADLKAEYSYKSESMYLAILYDKAKESLTKAGLYNADDIENYNLRIPYDDQGELEYVFFDFPKAHLDILNKYFSDTYITEEIHILLKENAAVFSDSDFPDFLPFR